MLAQSLRKSESHDLKSSQQSSLSSMSVKAQGIFQFGEFRIDALARTLRREAEVITLNYRAFDVLLYFVQNSGKVLTRDELLKNVWPDTFVDEHSLEQSISVLRRALDEKRGDNRYIVTLAGRGYQFVAPVQVITPDGKIVPELATADRNDPSELIFQKQTIEASVTTQEKERASSTVFGSRVPRVLGAIAATLAVSVATLGGAWYWRSYRTPKLTEKDTIVVADFENRTGDPVFDGTLKEAVAVDLDQSPYLNIVSDQKIGDALKLMSRDPGLPITGDVARDLCQRVNGNALLQGSIANFGKQYVVVLTTTNCATGDLLGAEQFRAESKEKILPALDKAVASLRGRLGESLRSIGKYATPVEQASTPSLAALQAYSAGLKALEDGGNLAAIPFFKRATELDPNFAMAYAHLGQASSDAGIAGPPYDDTTKAFGLRDRTSDRERFYIDSSYYDVVTGEFEKEVRVLEQWRQVYPREAKPARILAHLYRYLGRYEESLREARDSVRLEPDADSNYDQLVLSALMSNRLDEAQAALQARDPDSYRKAPNLYRLAFLRNDLAGMQRQEARIAGKEGEGLLLSLQSDTEAYYGHLRKARELTRRATEVEVGDKAAGWRAGKSAFEGCFREVFFGYSEEARRDVTAVLAVHGGRGGQYLAIMALALVGDGQRVEAIAADWRKDSPDDEVVNLYGMATARAAIQLWGHNNPAKAVRDLEVASRYELAQTVAPPLLPVYVRGQAFLALHQGAAAAAEFQKFVDYPGAVGNNPIGAVARMGLARAYAMQGDTVKARAAYEEFFSLWKDADPDIPILKEAKAEYSKLR
jgi:DNA-binding winged helix-turn-helix (wHTH) protein